MISSTLLFSSVEEDLRLLTENLKQLVGARHPILYAAAEYLFGTKGKRVRPAIVLLIARTTMPDRPITEKHRRLAEITEMIHTASLVHDDVVDESDLRYTVGLTTEWQYWREIFCLLNLPGIWQIWTTCQ